MRSVRRTFDIQEHQCSHVSTCRRKGKEKKKKCPESEKSTARPGIVVRLPNRYPSPLNPSTLFFVQRFNASLKENTHGVMGGTKALNWSCAMPGKITFSSSFLCFVLLSKHHVFILPSLRCGASHMLYEYTWIDLYTDWTVLGWQ